jgi:hypothetical protein
VNDSEAFRERQHPHDVQIGAHAANAAVRCKRRGRRVRSSP